MTSRSVVLVSLAFGCSEPTPPPAEALPARLVGAFGQTETHATMTTTGLEVTGSTLKLGDLTLTITQGAATGPDDYRVDLAEAAWPKDTKGPKPCTGTISRQGNVLLVRLFKQGTDSKCESVLDGEWREWSVLDAMPENLRGMYGGDARSEQADVGLRIGDKTIGFTDGGDELAIEQVLAFVDKPDVAYVRRSNFASFGCTGSLTLTDDRLAVALAPSADAPEGSSCPSGRGTRWSVDRKHLPTGAIDNGHVTITADGDVLTLVDRDGLRCKQTVLHTAARSVTGSAYDGIPVTGGAVLVLEHALAEPEAACKTKLGTVAVQLCGEGDSQRCNDATTAREQPIVCPRQVIIGDPTGGGQKAAMLPASLTNLTCWNMTGVFAGTK